MDEELDPILAYLLEFNETNPIKYKGRYLIPPGGLKEMLKNYKKFHLSQEEEKYKLTTTEELYALI